MKPGLYYDISFESYVKIDAVNNSTLKILSDQSPAHCRQYMDEGRPETQSLGFGRATDCYILEPALFEKQYVVGPDCRRGTNEWKDFEASVGPEMTILKPDEMDAIISIYNQVSKSQAMRLLEGGTAQVVAIWKDKKTDLLCKSRWDYFREDIPMITDLKTTRSAKPDEFARDVYKFGYYQQAAFYVEGYKNVVSDKHDCCFAIFAVEKVPPYVCCAYELGAKTLEAGRIAFRRALDLYAKCLEKDHWPAYEEKITMLDMPAWALTAAGLGPERMM